MKNLAKLVGITVLVAVIGFSMAACDDGNGGNGDRDTISIVVKNDTGSPIEAEVKDNNVGGDNETVVSGVGKKNINANSQATWTLKLKNFSVVPYIQVIITDTGKSAVITFDNNRGDSVICTWTGNGLYGTVT